MFALGFAAGVAITLLAWIFCAAARLGDDTPERHDD